MFDKDVKELVLFYLVVFAIVAAAACGIAYFMFSNIIDNVNVLFDNIHNGG